MQHLLRLCLWQAIIIGILTANFPVHAEEERGIRMRGPKSSDVFPYDKYGPITSQDTLWNIATRIRPDKRLSVYQVMQALYQENPQAFVDSNINYLVEGQYLKIPSFNNMMAINTNSARKKSENDSKAWKKAQPKSIKKEVFVEPSVKKKDLETVKTEINDQLQKIDGQQQERLELIQNDISDSIDGLQAILKENDDLRQRLSSFNDKLGVMQEEVAKGKEIKLQMDDMIKLQQALLAKAEAREQELLIEKELAALAEQDITSSLWFKILMGTLPAILILSLLAFLFKRRKQASDEVFFNELESKKQAPVAKKESPTEELSLDDELNLDDELDLSLDDELNLGDELDLSLDDELNLDDELDLSLDDELNLDDDLSIDSIDSDDDVIHLDENDALDELEDILLDDESDVDILDGGELGQDDLDSLLSGLDDDVDNTEESESEALEGGELSQEDLNDLLGGLDDSVDEELSVEESNDVTDETAEVTDPDDIDALLDSMNDTAEVTDPDDIDALLDSMNDSVSDSVDKTSEVTDPDDIDALLDSMNDSVSDSIDKTSEVTDPDDIDALLDSMNDTVEITDPDDIDSLLDSVNDTSEVTDPDDIDSLLDSVNDNAEVTDPDDIDALLDSMNDTAEITDPDDIDALLDSVNDTAEVTDPDDIDALLDSVNDTAEVTDPDDIDSLLDSVNDTAEVTDPDDIDSLLDSVNETAEVTDPDDIDALLESMSGNAPVAQQTPQQDLPEVINESETDSALSPEDLRIKNEKAENEAKISAFTAEYVTPFLTADFTDIMAKDSANELADETLTNTVSDELDDELDIDALIADTISKDEVDKSFNEDEKDDVGDDLINSPIDETIKTQVDGGFTEAELSQLLADDSLDDESNQAERGLDDATELSPDFTDEDVLAELLADIDDSGEEKLEEVDELDVIEELSNVDFDELLANIEEESATTPIESDDIDLTYGGLGDEVGDDLLDDSFIEESIQSAQDVEKSEDYLSVDDLISDSLDEGDVSEPYEKTNIDVGLGQFAQNDSGIDVDKDGSMSSKLDLAKMYIEMNDEENAQVILQEVISKGDAIQQVEAQALLDSL
jgi:pilus assembly protein FimV